MFVFALLAAIITVDMPSSHSARIVLLVAGWFALTLLINIRPIIRYFFHGETAASSAAAAGAAGNVSSRKMKSNRASRSGDETQNPALSSPAQVVPIADYVTPRVTTGEMVQPRPAPPSPSVTEETTNLLKNN
jgi:hypothetical protein